MWDRCLAELIWSERVLWQKAQYTWRLTILHHTPLQCYIWLHIRHSIKRFWSSNSWFRPSQWHLLSYTYSSNPLLIATRICSPWNHWFFWKSFLNQWWMVVSGNPSVNLAISLSLYPLSLVDVLYNSSFLHFPSQFLFLVWRRPVSVFWPWVGVSPTWIFYTTWHLFFLQLVCVSRFASCCNLFLSMSIR